MAGWFLFDGAKIQKKARIFKSKTGKTATTIFGTTDYSDFSEDIRTAELPPKKFCI